MQFQYREEEECYLKSIGIDFLRLNVELDFVKVEN